VKEEALRVALPQRRSVVEGDGSAYRVLIPARRNVFLLLFLGLWLTGWAVGFTSAWYSILREGPSPFMVVWLGGWSIGGMFVAYTWLWTAVGREIVSIAEGALKIKRDVLGLGPTREYDLSRVQNLRVSAGTPDPFGWSASTRSWGMPQAGVVAFDYGAKTFRFGGSIDEAEGTQIVRELMERHRFADA
jgi:hypothetical protein